MKNAVVYAVIDRDGFFDDETIVYSVHATDDAARRAAKKAVANIPGQGRMSTAMLIEGAGLCRGQTIYSDTIRTIYRVLEEE